MPAGIEFPYAEQIACVRRDVFDLDGQKISKEIALAITSTPADRAGPADLHTHVRQHWGIEKTKATTCVIRPGGKTTTKPTPETDRTPWRSYGTSPSDSSASTANTRSKKRPKRSAETG